MHAGDVTLAQGEPDIEYSLALDIVDYYNCDVIFVQVFISCYHSLVQPLACDSADGAMVFCDMKNPCL